MFQKYINWAYIGRLGDDFSGVWLGPYLEQACDYWSLNEIKKKYGNWFEILKLNDQAWLSPVSATWSTSVWLYAHLKSQKIVQKHFCHIGVALQSRVALIWAVPLPTIGSYLSYDLDLSNSMTSRTGVNSVILYVLITESLLIVGKVQSFAWACVLPYLHFSANCTFVFLLF